MVTVTLLPGRVVNGLETFLNLNFLDGRKPQAAFEAKTLVGPAFFRFWSHLAESSPCLRDGSSTRMVHAP